MNSDHLPLLYCILPFMLICVLLIVKKLQFPLGNEYYSLIIVPSSWKEINRLLSLNTTMIFKPTIWMLSICYGQQGYHSSQHN